MNGDTWRGRADEVGDVRARRKTDIRCAQETLWKGRSASFISGKDCKVKYFWVGDIDGFGNVSWRVSYLLTE